MHKGMSRLAGVVAVTAVGLVGVAACGTSKSEGKTSTASPGYSKCATQPDTCNSGPRRAGGTIVVALGKYPSTWNQNSSAGSVVETVEQENLILPSTFIFLPSGKIQYNTDLLTTAPKVTNQNPETVVYHLNPKAVWSNGSPVNADDFVYAWQTTNGHDPNIPVAGTNGYRQIRSVTASDNGETVTVVFKTPFTDWQGLFNGLFPAWYAKQKVGGLDTDAQLETAFKLWDAPPTAYSAGPYVLSNFQSQQSATFTPNPKWYGHDKPTLKSITFRYITDQTQDIPALQNQEIQALDVQPDQDTVRQLAQMPDVNYEISAGLSWELLELNSESKVLKDIALREAIIDATNVQDMINKTIKPFFPTATRDYNDNLFPGEPGYQDVTNRVTPDGGTGNVTKAKQVLQAAGYTYDGAGNLVAPNGGSKVTITFRHTDTQVRDQSATLFQSYMRQIGITVNDKVTADLGGTLNSGDFDVIQFGYSYSNPLLGNGHDTWYNPATSGKGSNFTGWHDPQSDALLDQMVRTLDQTKQGELLDQQDAIMAKAFVTVALYRKPDMVASTKAYINLRNDNYGSHFTYNTQQWGLSAAQAVS
jgi:peptide/nickel transport system substrate-binding protein